MRWIVICVAGSIAAAAVLAIAVVFNAAASFGPRETARQDAAARETAERLTDVVAPLKNVNLTSLMTFEELKTALRDPDAKLAPRTNPASAFVRFYDQTVEAVFFATNCEKSGIGSPCGEPYPIQMAIRPPFPGTLFGIRFDTPRELAVRRFREDHPKIQELRPNCWALYRFTSDERPWWVVVQHADEVSVYNDRYTVELYPNVYLFPRRIEPPPSRFCDGGDRVLSGK